MRLCAVLVFCATTFVVTAFAENAITPAQTKIESAQRAIKANPENYTPYNELAFALTRRARETAAPKFYEQALAALDTSRKLSPDNFEGEKIRVWALLGLHEFGEAYKLAKTLNAKVPDDVQVYGLLTDAAAELGEYKEAENATQWMFNLRPGNVAALTRAAYLREMFGDVDGALELMQQAYQRTPPLEKEERAWLLTQIAHLQLTSGRIESAEKHASEALKQFPNYHYALAQMGAVRMHQGKAGDAVEFYRQRYEQAAHPENLFDLGVALHAAGKRAESQKSFAEFEKLALKESASWDNANRELIRYYTDYANQPAKALKIAEMQIKQRRDVYSLEAYAWALHRSSRFAEAKIEIAKALDVGVLEPRMLYRAAMIYAKAGDRKGSETLLQKAKAAHPDPVLLAEITRATNTRTASR